MLPTLAVKKLTNDDCSFPSSFYLFIILDHLYLNWDRSPQQAAAVQTKPPLNVSRSSTSSEQPKKQQFVDIPSTTSSELPYHPNSSKPNPSNSRTLPTTSTPSHDTKLRTSTVPADRTASGQKETNPNSVFAYLDEIPSIECRTGAGGGSSVDTSTGAYTYNEDTPSTSRGGGSSSSVHRTSAPPSGAGVRASNTADPRQAARDSDDVVDLSQDDELSETLEYDASQPLFTE